MSQLEIVPVKTGRQQKQFLMLPWELNRDDPNWVPPLRTNQKELVNYKKHPFFDTNEIQTFLALRAGKPVGRIAAIVNHGHIKQYGERIGFWGFFESIDDEQVAKGLFAAARAWLATKDLHKLRGPANPSLNYECGLLVDGFDTPPFFMMTHNKPFYERLVIAAGNACCQNMFAYWGHMGMIDTVDKKLGFVIEESTRRFNLTVRRLDRKKFNQDVRLFLSVYNQALVGTWGFVPMSEREIDHMSAGLKHLIVPEMTTIAESEGKAVGAVFGLLDYNPIVKKIDGRLFPFGFLRLLFQKKTINRIRLISTNVVPEYQKWGIGLVLLHRLLPDCQAWGVKEAEFSWVLESNHLSRKTLERAGTKLTKTYRMYDG